jgi:NAD-dependent deacetylase
VSGVADGALQKDIEKAAGKLAAAKKVVVLTGAGVSKESGIPTFRDALTGLWANYEPEKLATPQGFLADPPLVWQWYDFRRKKVLEVEPNPGHYAIAQLELLIPEVVVVTQNVDGLHRRAGSSDIVELHGNIMEFFCFDKRHPAKRSSSKPGADHRSPPVSVGRE